MVHGAARRNVFPQSTEKGRAEFLPESAVRVLSNSSAGDLLLREKLLLPPQRPQEGVLGPGAPARPP